MNLEQLSDYYENANISAQDRQVWSEIVATSTSSGRPTAQNTTEFAQHEMLAESRGGLEGTASEDDLKQAIHQGTRQGSSARDFAGVEDVGRAALQHARRTSEYGAWPGAGLPRDGAYPGSRSLANLNNKERSTQQQPSANQTTLETDNRAGDANAEGQAVLAAGLQASSKKLEDDYQRIQQIYAKRDSFKQREDDLEERYRQLQGFAHARIGSVNERVPVKRGHSADFGKDTETDRNPPVGFSIQRGPPRSGAWQNKQSLACPESGHMSHTERPAADQAHMEEMKRLHQYNDQEQALTDVRGGNQIQDDNAEKSRQVQVENVPCTSQSQTEVEVHDLGIEYDKNHAYCPMGLNLISTSNAGSQSQNSQGKNFKRDSARDSQVLPSQYPFSQQDQQIRTFDSSIENQEEINWPQRMQKDSEKMQTGSFKATAEGLETSLGRTADMKNVTAMLYRAMNYKQEKFNYGMGTGDGADYKMRNSSQSRVGTRETQQSKTTDVTQVLGHERSNSQMIEKTGLDATLLSVTHQIESKKELPAQREESGEQRLKQELDRIQNQKKMISSYLPRDYEYQRESSPLSPSQAANPETTVHKEEGHERGHSNSSFGKAYNFGMNLSSKFGRNIQEQLNVPKSPAPGHENRGNWHCNQDQARRSGSRDWSHHTGGQDGHGTSKDYRSGFEGRTQSNGPVTGYSNFAMLAGDKELPKEVLNYRDLSQDASRRSRAALQATDRPISYPTNMTNMTHDQIAVSPESSNQAQKRSSIVDQAPLSHNEISNRGLSWRVEGLPPQPLPAANAAGDALTSQAREAAGKQELQDRPDFAVRSRSREVEGLRIDSPSARRKSGLSPYSKSSRHRDLQHSGLALLKKTSALLKNPPAVSNYKALNFDQEQEVDLAQPFDSQKSIDSNATRKGVIHNLYRKNSAAGTLNDSETDHRQQSYYAYHQTVGQSHEGKRDSFRPSLLDQNTAFSQQEKHQRTTAAGLSPIFDSRKYQRVPPRGGNLSKERSSGRGGLLKSGKSDRAAAQSQGAHRAPGKLTLGFLRRLNRNGGREPDEKGRSTTDERTEGRWSAKSPLRRDQKDSESHRPNLTNVNEARNESGDADASAATSAKAEAPSRAESYGNGKSAISKINRYKKFERELEKQRAAWAAMDERARKEKEDKEAAEAARAYDVEPRRSAFEGQARHGGPSGRQQRVRDQQYRNWPLEEQVREQAIKGQRNQYQSGIMPRSHRGQGPEQDFAPSSGPFTFDQRGHSPHRALDSHRGSVLTLGNQQRAPSESSPSHPMTKEHEQRAASVWKEGGHPQGTGSYNGHHDSCAFGQMPLGQPSSYPRALSRPSELNPPRLNYNYFAGPGGGRAEPNAAQGTVDPHARGPGGVDQRPRSNSLLRSTFQEEDSMQVHNGKQQQEEIPSQIHGSRPAAGSSAHLPSEGSFGRRRHSVEGNRPQARHESSLQSEEGPQNQDKSRARSHAQAGPRQELVKRMPLLDQYLQKNEELRRQQRAHHRQDDGLRAVSPAPSNGDRSRSNLSRHDLIPCRGPPSVPHQGHGLASSDMPHIGIKEGDDERADRIKQLKQNQVLLQQKAQELREASFERPRHRDQQLTGDTGRLDQYTWQMSKIEGPGFNNDRPSYQQNCDCQNKMRDPSPASLACMDLKSSFGKKMREQADPEGRCCSASKPPLFGLQKDQTQASGYSLERGANMSGSKNELIYQCESFRPHDLHRLNSAQSIDKAIHAGQHDQQTQSSEKNKVHQFGEQPGELALVARNCSRCSRTQGYPSGPAQIQSFNIRPSQAEIQNWQQSAPSQSSGHPMEGAVSLLAQPKEPEGHEHDLMGTRHWHAQAGHSEQTRHAERADGFGPEGYQNHYPNMDDGGTPQLPSAPAPVEEGKLSTMKMLRSCDSQAHEHLHAESKTTYDNQSQAQSEGQTIGSNLRSNEIHVNSTDLAQDERQEAAARSKQQEPSMAATRSSPRRSGRLKGSQRPGSDAPAGASSEEGDIKKLIKLQFEQARMLMDLQKQFIQCQEIEKVHQLESMEQSMSQQFQDGTINTSKAASSQRQNISTTILGEVEQEPTGQDECALGTNEANFEQYQLPKGRAEGAAMASDKVHQGQQPGSEVPARAATPQIGGEKNAHQKVHQIQNAGEEPGEAAGASPLLQHERGQAPGSIVGSLNASALYDQPTSNPSKKSKSSKRLAAERKSQGPLTHQSRQSSIAIPNSHVMESNRSLLSGASRQSQAHLSHISKRKASTMALIQKIYQQMEKIDNQISHKERLDEERYQDMERRMRKLCKKYNKVKRDNEKIQIESSHQLLSLQPSQRQKVRSLAVEPGPQSCDFDRGKKTKVKMKSSKETSGAKDRQKSRAERAKGSLLSESKPLSSVQVTDRTIQSVLQDGGQNKQRLRDKRRIEMYIAEHDAQLNQKLDRGDFRVINNSSALSQSYGAQAQTPGLETKITQVNELLADQPLRPSDCMSTSQKEVQMDFNQQFPSAKRSQGGTDLSGASSGQSKSDAATGGPRYLSFGAQFPSAHAASPHAALDGTEPCSGDTAPANRRDFGDAYGPGVDQEGHQSQEQRALPAFPQQEDLRKSSRDASSLNVNSVPSQTSRAGPAPAYPQMSQDAEPKGSSRLLTQSNALAGGSSRSLKPLLPSQKQAATAPRQERALTGRGGAEAPEDEDHAVTCSSRDVEKEAVVLLGSTIGMAEDTLQIQTEIKPGKPAKAYERGPVEAIPEVKALASNQNELENQVQLMNGAITQLRAEHQQQIETMKSYYQEQINQIREEVHKRERSQSRGRAGVSSGMGTPAAALQTRMKSLSNENILNLTNLSISASEQKLPPSHHQGTMNAPSPNQVPRQHVSTSASQKRLPASATQKEQENDTPDIAVRGQTEQALSKLMDQNKFTDTLEQLNKAVNQKERLEQKLLRIKEKIQMAKNIKNQQRRRSQERDQLDGQNDQQDFSVQIVSQGADVQSTIGADAEDNRGEDANKGQDVQGNTVHSELAGLSGVTLSDVAGRTREANQESTAPILSPDRDGLDSYQRQQVDTESSARAPQPQPIHERLSSMAGSSGDIGEPTSLMLQVPPVYSGKHTSNRNILKSASTAGEKVGSAKEATGPASASYHSRQPVGEKLGGQMGQDTPQGAGDVHAGAVDAQKQFESGLHYNYVPRDLVAAPAGAHGPAQAYTKEMQPAGTPGNGAAAAGQVENQVLMQRISPRRAVAPFTAYERFLQPFVPGRSALPAFEPRDTAGSLATSLQNSVAQQYPSQIFNHSTALAPGVTLLEQQHPHQLDQLLTLQQTRPEPVEGLNEMYLRDTSQQASTAGPQPNHQSTLESTAQNHVRQDTKRGIYQRIVGLQNLQSQQRSTLSSGAYGPFLQRKEEPSYAFPLGQQVFGAQQPHQSIGSGPGAPTTASAAGASLSFSVPATRMATITSSQAPRAIYMPEQREVLPGQQAYLAAGYDVRKSSPLQRLEQQLQKVDDFRGQQLVAGHLPAPHIAQYPTNSVNSSSSPLYVQPHAVWTQPHPQSNQGGVLHAQAPQVPHAGLPVKPASSIHQVQSVHPTFYHPGPIAYASQGPILQPRFLDQKATNAADQNGLEPTDEDASYTMHSASMEGTSRSEETSGATSEASSSCPYSENTIGQHHQADLNALQVNIQQPDHSKPADGGLDAKHLNNLFTNGEQ